MAKYFLSDDLGAVNFNPLHDVLVDDAGSMRDVSVQAGSYGASAGLWITDNEEGVSIFLKGMTIGQLTTHNFVNDYDGSKFIYGNNAVGVAGDQAANTLVGSGADDAIRGAGGNDHISGLAGDDSLHGGSGKDTISGGDGFDSIRGESGADAISGGNLSDRVDGGGGNDVIHGNSGNDFLVGAGGADQLFGDLGSDSLIGGRGFDVLTGGADFDDFGFNLGDSTFTTAAGQIDRITDFDSGDDEIREFVTGSGSSGNYTEVDTADATTAAALDSAHTQAGLTGGDQTYVFVGGAVHGWLFINTDGNEATFEEAIRLDNLDNINEFDFNDISS